MNREADVCVLSMHALRSRSRFSVREKFTVWVPLIWISSWNVKLMLADDTSFVQRLPGENASTRSVGGEGLARTVPTMETDVLPETPNVFTTAVLGTSASKRVWVVSTETVRKYAVAESRASPDQPQIQSFKTILPQVDVLACLLLDAFLSLTTDAKLSRLRSSGQDCLASSELSCPMLSKFPRVPASFSMDKALPWSPG